MVKEDRANHPNRRPQQLNMLGSQSRLAKSQRMGMVTQGPQTSARLQSQTSFGRSDVLGYRTWTHPMATGLDRLKSAPLGQGIGRPSGPMHYPRAAYAPPLGEPDMGGKYTSAVRTTAFKRAVLPQYFGGLT